MSAALRVLFPFPFLNPLIIAMQNFGVLSPVPTTYPMGDTILTWHFTDASGNTTTCPQTVTVKDKFAPVVDCDTLKNIVAELTTNDCRLSCECGSPFRSTIH
jgi:hypothetical protein